MTFNKQKMHIQRSKAKRIVNGKHEIRWQKLSPDETVITTNVNL